MQFVVAVAMTLGLMLAAGEGWPVMDGFYYVVGNMCGLATPLTSASPTTTFGRFMDIVVSVWAISVVATFIGIVSGMAFLHTMADTLDQGKIKTITGVDVDLLMKKIASYDALTLAEFKQCMLESGYNDELDKLDAVFEKYDSNSSGTLEPDETKAMGKSFDVVLDENEYGAVTDAVLIRETTKYATNYEMVHRLNTLARRMELIEDRLEKETRESLSQLEARIAEMHRVLCPHLTEHLQSDQLQATSEPVGHVPDLVNNPIDNTQPNDVKIESSPRLS
eukprot:TRINITY_DN7839_c0_g1_i2.p1 TRINITY_DN7839_c0_g1~~TRINITY_DN7839_c0_g1_i2.p1  ORF type:complete len:279 (-),score=71.16 TRINITY_DN7839_c0_g1_i2:82-918(-)